MIQQWMIISVYHGIPIMTWAGEVWPEVPLEGGVQNFALPRFHSIHKLSSKCHGSSCLVPIDLEVL